MVQQDQGIRVKVVQLEIDDDYHKKIVLFILTRSADMNPLTHSEREKDESQFVELLM